MTLEEIEKMNMSIAAEKGFGGKPEEINTPEKFTLIHSEISEAYEAWEMKNLDGKHGFYEEIADTLLRILHLAGIYGITVPQPGENMKIPEGVDAQTAALHLIISTAYENYRHKRMDEFRQGLITGAYFVLAVGQMHGFDVLDEARKKMNYNKNRTYNISDMNENIK